MQSLGFSGGGGYGWECPGEDDVGGGDGGSAGSGGESGEQDCFYRGFGGVGQGTNVKAIRLQNFKLQYVSSRKLPNKHVNKFLFIMSSFLED